MTPEQLQQQDLQKIERFAEALGWLVTSYVIAHKSMPAIKQVNGVDQNGLPTVEFRI